jgi:hypothetical protein
MQQHIINVEQLPCMGPSYLFRVSSGPVPSHARGPRPCHLLLQTAPIVTTSALLTRSYAYHSGLLPEHANKGGRVVNKPALHSCITVPSLRSPLNLNLSNKILYTCDTKQRHSILHSFKGVMNSLLTLYSAGA